MSLPSVRSIGNAQLAVHRLSVCAARSGGKWLVWVGWESEWWNIRTLGSLGLLVV